MIRLAAAQLRHRAGRALVLLLGILTAATGFSVLTGTAQTQRLEIVGSVKDNYRAQYDILVRPKGSATAIERETGMVRANYLSGIHGGITLDQLDRIRRLDGIDVAAPIGMVGYFTGTGRVQVPVTGALGPGERTLLRVERTRVADRKLTKIPGAPHYQYVTRRPLSFTMDEGDRLDLTTEDLGGGRETKLGTALSMPEGRANDPFHQGPTADAWSTSNGKGDGVPLQWGKGGAKEGQAMVDFAQDFPLLAEKVRAYLKTHKGTVVQQGTLKSEQFYQDLLDTWTNQGKQLDQTVFAPLTRYWTAGPVGYRRDGSGVLTPQPVTNDAKIWKDPDWVSGAPIGSADTQFRERCSPTWAD
ncbi:hypothetical protein ACGFJC_52630 [Nonomuraea fuscirosea]|uniref:hypothetical protein n=1 Tax=Nonomuraea fuscirosea TaxID=1291556 RepID=UPI00349130FD